MSGLGHGRIKWYTRMAVAMRWWLSATRFRTTRLTLNSEIAGDLRLAKMDITSLKHRFCCQISFTLSSTTETFQNSGFDCHLVIDCPLILSLLPAARHNCEN